MNTDATYTYGKLNTSQLKVDRSYQRDINPTRVKQLADHFNPLKVNPAKVSHRNGAYYIFDGQHTTRVLVTRNGGKDLFIECKIYEGLSKQDEAELFARQNEGTRQVEKNSQMKALYTAGDIEIIELKNAVEEVGFIFDFQKGKSINRIVCCAQMLKIFRTARCEDFKKFLLTIKEAWNGMPESLRKEIIGGTWILYSTFKGKIDMDVAARKFSLVSPAEIIREGKALKTMPGDTKYAYMMGVIYNKGQRKNKLDLNELTQK